MDTPKALPPHQQIALLMRRVEQFDQAGRPLEAERECRAILAVYPQAAGALNYLGVLLKARGELGEAEVMMRRALAVVPREPALHNNLGNILGLRNDLPGAESSYRKALAIKGDYAEAWYNLGVILQRQESDEQALAALRKAVAIRPAYVEAKIQIAVLLSKSGGHAEALEILRPIAAAQPANFAARYYSGHALTALGQLDDAIAELEKARLLSPQSHEVMFALGNAHNAARHDEEALAGYRAAIDLAPDYLEAHYAYNLLAGTMGRSDAALASYAQARARIGDQPDLLLAEANQRIRQDDAAGAEPLLWRAREMAPLRADITNALGRALTMRKHHGEAAELLAAAVAAEPRNVHHRRELGVALLQDGQLAPARQALEEALALAPHDQLTLAYLSLAYRELGDSRLARLVDPERHVRTFDLAPPAGYSDAAAFNLALGEELLALHTRQQAPFDQTLRGGTQTIGHLFETPGVAVGLLQERIREAVADYIRDLPDDAAHPLLGRKTDDIAFSGAWSCRLRSSGFHTNHVHHMGWLSSAYYVSLPEEIDDTKQRQGWLKFGESWLGLGDQDKPSRFEKPVVGKLVLFPSYYWHGTVPFTAEEARLAVAFDVLPKI